MCAKTDNGQDCDIGVLHFHGLHQIRTMHPFGFRSGKWAEYLGTIQVAGRRCYSVKFSDGATDEWVIDDPDGQYELEYV